MRVVNTGIVWGGHDGCLLGVVIVLSGAAIVAAGTGAEGFSSREVEVGAGTSTRCGWFRYFLLGVVSEVVFVVGKGDGGESELELSGEPTRGSRDSSEDFVVVVRGEYQISVNVVGSTGSDHAATFFCLDRVIVASGGV